jgi:hypothetical protein
MSTRRRKETKKNVKIKEEKKNDIAMLKEMRRQKKRTKKIQSKKIIKKPQKNHRKPVHLIKEMNEKNQSNSKRKSVIRTQRWRLRIKLQKDNTDKQPTVPEESLTIAGPNMTEKRKN